MIGAFLSIQVYQLNAKNETGRKRKRKKTKTKVTKV